jgi:hypothetical protein
MKRFDCIIIAAVYDRRILSGSVTSRFCLVHAAVIDRRYRRA